MLFISFCCLKTELQFYLGRHCDQLQIPPSPIFLTATRGQWIHMGIVERCLFQKEKALSSFCLPQCLNVCDPWKYSSCLATMHEHEDDKVTALKGGKCVLHTAPTARLHHNANLKLTTSQLTVNWNKLIPVCLSYEDLVFSKASSSPSNSAILSISFLQWYPEKGQIDFLPFWFFFKEKIS